MVFLVLNVQLNIWSLTVSILYFMVSSFNKFCFDLTSATRGYLSVKLRIYKNGLLQLVSEPWFKGFGHSRVVSA